MTTTLTPAIQPRPTTKNQVTAMAGSPFAGQIGAGTTPYTSPWIVVPTGSLLRLALLLANLTGTCDVSLETIHNPDNPAAQPRAMPGGPFRIPGSGGATEATFGPSDAYFRIVYTPGTGAGQNCDWTVSGTAHPPSYAPVGSVM